MSPMPAILVLTPRGLATAARIRAGLDGGDIRGRAGRVDTAVTFDDMAAALRACFVAGQPIVALCAAGLVVRALAPVLHDKTAEPPVVVVAEDGGVVIPLLGGHHGANDLARRIAEGLGVTAAITTAGDLAFGLALDAPPSGWRLANPDDAKAFMAGLLAGAGVALTGEAPWLADSDLPFAQEGGYEIRCGVEPCEGGPRRLVYHPARIAVGLGSERGVEAAEVAALIEQSLAEAGISPLAIGGLFSLDLKVDEAAFHAAAESLRAPFRVFDLETLRAEEARLETPSEAVAREVGVAGVAEAAALAAAGPDGTLILAKRKSRRATCALALAPEILAAERMGRARGRLAIVGLGPGRADWRTPEAARALASAGHLVGYKLYLDLAGEAPAGQKAHAYELGQEEERARDALDLAAGGENVALVSSGDPGVYAMASLVYELIDGADAASPWRRVALEVAPGLTAMQAAAARAGAPLGHDFCAISLSDLLTPHETILQRIQAAAAGDFVVAFYNPVSATRRRLLPEAKRILLRHRRPDTPVVLARQLGRDAERVRIVGLSDLDVAMVDMLTLVIVGSSQTRVYQTPSGGQAVYTPRGYAIAENAEATP